jgi:hypothetical protein
MVVTEYKKKERRNKQKERIKKPKLFMALFSYSSDGRLH